MDSQRPTYPPAPALPTILVLDSSLILLHYDAAMSLEGIKDVLRQTPFRPFKIRMTSGKEYTVDHPEFISASGTFRRLYVSTPGTDRVDTLDTLMVESLHYGDEQRAAA